VELSPLDLRGDSELERAVAEFARVPNGGVIVTAAPAANVHRERINALMARHRLPAVYPFRYYVESGGLVGYGPDIIGQYRPAAGYVDRILKGEKPSSPSQTGQLNVQLGSSALSKSLFSFCSWSQLMSCVVAPSKASNSASVRAREERLYFGVRQRAPSTRRSAGRRRTRRSRAAGNILRRLGSITTWYAGGSGDVSRETSRRGRAGRSGAPRNASGGGSANRVICSHASHALTTVHICRRMPVYVKRFRNRLGRLALCRSASDLVTECGGEPRPTNLDALCPGSRHASSCPFADLLRLDLG
jgi:hypothetical protein